MGLWFLSTIWRDSRDLPIMDTLRPNIHLGSTLRLRSTTQKTGDGFKVGVWQSGKSSQEACTTDLVLDSCFGCPAWQALESRSIIWIYYSTGIQMCSRFYCGPQGAHNLGCSLDHCGVPRPHRVYQGLLQMLLSLWGMS